jgi:hypothetical protein
LANQGLRGVRRLPDSTFGLYLPPSANRNGSYFAGLGHSAIYTPYNTLFRIAPIDVTTAISHLV